MKLFETKMKTEKKFEIRRFLNRKGYHSSAFIYAYLHKCFYKSKKKTKYYFDAELKITDCDRQINISIDLDTKNEIKNTLYKLNNMISTISLFKEFCEEELNKK
jgi:hypothetical protein